MVKSRTQFVYKNMIIALLCQAINLIFNLFSRTIFIKALGKEYLGVNGLFTNILTILSFTELGIGNAIIFSMYKPLATNDEEKLNSLMALYKKTYKIIGIIIAVVGVSVAPLIKFLINDVPDISESIILLYLLFLFNTVASYFFIYKKSIIIADQKNYVVQVILEGIHVVQVILQIVFLYLTHNFIAYLLIQICCTLLGNILISAVADKLYPFLKEKAQPLDKVESKNIFKNVRALSVYKFGSVVLNGTDNILVSALIGVKEVALVSNYILLSTSCNTILGKITEAFTASIGNLNTSDDKEKKYNIFNKLFFITAWLYGFVSIGLITVSNNFIVTWLDSSYLIDKATMIAIVAGFYVSGVHFAAYTYRTTHGFFIQGRIAPICAAILNIILSIALCKQIGLAGIFIATPISRLLTTGLIDPILIYKKAFNMNPIFYYLKYIAYIALFTIIGFVCAYFVSLVTLSGWIGIILKIILVTLTFNGIMFLLFYRTQIFKELCQALKSILKKTKA